MSKPLGQTASPETVENKEEPTVIWSKKEKDTSKEIYGTELLIESGCKEDVKTTEAPTDAMIVTYEFAGKERQDLTRGSRVDVFDMYYDKFKSGLKSIDYGYGNIKPNLWGYQSTQGPKKKKRK
tara:strand:+ start:848 stop:1219 length:372 start_codon:yes stop_codon:yes gene_type:complete